MKPIKSSLVVLLCVLGASISQAQNFGNDTLSIVTKVDCDSRHEGTLRAVLNEAVFAEPLDSNQKVAVYRVESDRSLYRMRHDYPRGFIYERKRVVTGEYKIRWFYSRNHYTEVSYTIADTPPIVAELYVEQSTEAADCQDGGAYLAIDRDSSVKFWTSWSSQDSEVTLSGLDFSSSDSAFRAGNWNVRLYGSEGCDEYTTPSTIDGSPVHNAIAEFDFIIECCIKNPALPSVRDIKYPDARDSSNGGFHLLGNYSQESNLIIDAYEWSVYDTNGEWVPPIDGDSGPDYDGLPAGEYTFEADTDEMYDNDVFKGCDMPTMTFTLGVRADVDSLHALKVLPIDGEGN